MKDQTAFSTRFAHHKDELEWLFMELYHNREGLEVLEREMAQAYNARSAELKALDKARTADPEWYKRGNMFGMTMYTVSYSSAISLSDSLTIVTSSVVSTMLSVAILLTRAVIPLIAIASAIAITSTT